MVYTEQQVIEEIRGRCQAPNTQASVAAQVGVSQTYLGRLLLGKDGLSTNMAFRFGFIEQERTFVKVEEMTNG